VAENVEKVLPQPVESLSTVASLGFEDVYRTQGPFVWNYLRRHGVNDADIEDVLHDVFVVVHQKLPDFDAAHPSGLRAWIYSIAFRVASEHRRRRARRREISGHELEARDPGPGPEADVRDREARAGLLDALSRLPEAQRDVFVLHDIEEQPMPVISEMLGVPTATLYSRLRLARERLARMARRLRSLEVSDEHVL
jgi:RNA polymerase sigma factor (sigma-70 family)